MKYIRLKNIQRVFIFLLFVACFIGVKNYKAHADECYPAGPVGCHTEDVQTATQTNDVTAGAITTANMSDALAAIGCDQMLTCPNRQGQINQANLRKSIVGQMAMGIGTIYDSPPASIAYWVDDAGQTLGFIPKHTYAQGTGFIGLSPLLNIWKAFRNIAYILIALSLVVIGFMIMFRRKIDPQTVVSVQNALPRVIVTLILITFSYAIAGLLIDLMYIIFGVLFTLLGTSFNVNSSQMMSEITNGNVGVLWGKVFSPLTLFNSGAFGIAAGALTGISGVVAGPFAILAFILVAAVTGAAGGAAGGAISPLLWLLFAIALFFAFFRILFMLIGAYVQVILSVIFGPLQILMDVFPGTNGFSSWFLGLVNNLLTFVFVGGLLTIIGLVIDSLGAANTSALWAPPIIGGVDPGMVKIMIGVGGLMIIPTLVNNFKQALKAPSGIPVGAGVGGGLSQPFGAGMQLITLGASLRQLSQADLWNRIIPGGKGGGGGVKSH